MRSDLPCRRRKIRPWASPAAGSVGALVFLLAPLRHRLAPRIFHRGESFYNFPGLRSFKDKFDPEWQPRYIGVPSAWSQPSALLDATARIGSGPRKTLSRS